MSNNEIVNLCKNSVRSALMYVTWNFKQSSNEMTSYIVTGRGRLVSWRTWCLLNFLNRTKTPQSAFRLGKYFWIKFSLSHTDLTVEVEWMRFSVCRADVTLSRKHGTCIKRALEYVRKYYLGGRASTETKFTPAGLKDDKENNVCALIYTWLCKKWYTLHRAALKRISRLKAES